MYEDEIPTEVDQGAVLSGVYHFSEDGIDYGLVVTPTCDFEQDKAAYVQVCRLMNAWDLVEEIVRTTRTNAADMFPNESFKPWDEWSNNKSRRFTDLLKKIVNNNYPRYAWLKAFASIDHPLIGDFQQITSHPAEELQESAASADDDATLVARLRSPFRESVCARYASYMARVGTPDITATEHQEYLEAWIAHVNANEVL